MIEKWIMIKNNDQISNLVLIWNKTGPTKQIYTTKCNILIVMVADHVE